MRYARALQWAGLIVLSVAVAFVSIAAGLGLFGAGLALFGALEELELRSTDARTTSRAP